MTMVHRARLELASPDGHQFLKLACLPFHHLCIIWRSESDSNTHASFNAASLAGRCLTIRLSLHMAPDGGVDPHGLAATHGFQDRCQRRLTSSGKYFWCTRRDSNSHTFLVAGLEPAASPHSATCACGTCEGSRTLNPCGIRA